MITVMHCLQASERGTGGSGLDVGLGRDGLSTGTEGRRRGEPGEPEYCGSSSTSLSLMDMDAKSYRF